MSKSASSTIRYRALPDSSRAKASLIRLIGKLFGLRCDTVSRRKVEHPLNGCGRARG
jgi:hypothetical protein